MKRMNDLNRICLNLLNSEYELNENQFNMLYEFVMRELTEYDYMSVHFVDDFEEFLDFFFEVVNMREQG